MENLKRPSEHETDDDLLEQQNKFFKEIKNPSAKYVSLSSRPSNDSPQENAHEISNAREFNTKLDKKEIEKDIEEVTGDIIFDVKERDVSFNEPFVFQPPPIDPKEMSQKLINIKLGNEKKAKGQSIFAQLLRSSGSQNFNNLKKVEYNTFSTLVDGSGLQADSKNTEIKEIHEENIKKLASMSKEEILRHQEELKNYLKPEILNFIKQKKQKKDDCSLSNKIIRNEKETDLPGKILRKEGKEDCDALILEKALQLEKIELSQEIDNTYNTENIELPEETKELIQGTKKGLWRNMDKIEKEKLEWMTNLPQPKPVDLKTGYAARFDFEGKLLSQEADIPTYEGLHHHGKDPEVPGYSLEELFLLARSSLQSQRITALNTIAHILENNWYGIMDSCFDAPLLPSLLNGGIVPLLRWALDDTSLTSISATVSAIHSLLISKPDEACVNKTFCWLNGHFVPQLEPQDLDEPNVVIEELTDADLIKLDVVKGFLRIDILPRFMYILKVMCPPPLVCKLIIEICARLAQHSTESAKQVATYPGLLNLIFEKFLPLSWQIFDSSKLTDTVDYSCPMYSALKLLRVIASSSKEQAFDLVEKYDILPIITYYLTFQPYDGKLPPQEVQKLVIEALKTWHTFLCYGLAINIFLDLFSIFVKQMQFCLRVNLNWDVQKHLQDFDYATHLFKCFEAVTVLASEKKDEGEKLDSAILLIYEQALLCLRTWIWQFSHDVSSSYGMALLAACMNFIVTHCKKSHDGLTCENWKPCSAAKDAFEECLLPEMKSNIFLNMLSNFRSFSLYLNTGITGNKRDGKTIVSLGSVLYGEDVVPILKEGSPLPLLSAILNYTLFYKNSFQDCQNECLGIILCPPILEYMKDISTKNISETSWFLMFETYFIYQLVQLVSMQVSKEATICHETAVSILPAFTFSEECLIEDLFENIIFNQSVITKLSMFIQPESKQISFLQLVASRLPVIAQCYISCFLDKNAVYKSRNMLFRNSDIDSLFCLSTRRILIPKDWYFMPIFYLYQNSKKRKREENITPEETLQVISSLQWIALCHFLNLPLVKRIPGSAEFYYLCLVFLLDENLFRDQKVKDLLIECISLVLKQKTLKLTKVNWNDIKTFDDIYLEMLIQYEAVSYGDETFGNFLVIPLQQCYPREWKKLLLTEHVPVLRFFRVSLLNLLVPIQNFLEPVETDLGLLSEYFRVLASGSLDYRRCPLLYLMAVHHIHSFVFTESQSHINDQKHLLLYIVKAKKDLQKKLLLYSGVNVKSEYGFNMTDELSSEKQKYISDITGQYVNL